MTKLVTLFVIGSLAWPAEVLGLHKGDPFKAVADPKQAADKGTEKTKSAKDAAIDDIMHSLENGKIDKKKLAEELVKMDAKANATSQEKPTVTPVDKTKTHNEPLQRTTVDKAIEECQADLKTNGCNMKDSPIHCLATAVRQKASDISPKCRQSTETALSHACAAELLAVKCNSAKQPLPECLDKPEVHGLVGPECLDFLTVTKKADHHSPANVPAAHAATKAKPSMAQPVVHHDDSSAFSFVFFMIIAATAFTLWYTEGRAYYKVMGLVQRELESYQVPGIPGRKNNLKSFDWTAALDDTDKPCKPMTNFASYGGL